jgi:SAM-dependent methyltransferase
MTASDGPARFGHRDSNSPGASWRTERLVRELGASRPGSIVDLGCGLGTLLRSLARAVPEARCTGVEQDAELVARARAAAADLGGRFTVVEADAASWAAGPVDLAVCVGSSHALGGTARALERLFDVVAPGGRVLFADCFWERPPTAPELAAMWEGTTADEFTDLPGLVDISVAAGFRPLRIESVERSEWEDFESELAADAEVWLVEHPGHPRAAEVRERADESRRLWLRGHRGLLGFAYLTLARPVSPRGGAAV